MTDRTVSINHFPSRKAIETSAMARMRCSTVPSATINHFPSRKAIETRPTHRRRHTPCRRLSTTSQAERQLRLNILVLSLNFSSMILSTTSQAERQLRLALFRPEKNPWTLLLSTTSQAERQLRLLKGLREFRPMYLTINHFPSRKAIETRTNCPPPTPGL